MRFSCNEHTLLPSLELLLPAPIAATRTIVKILAPKPNTVNMVKVINSNNNWCNFISI